MSDNESEKNREVKETNSGIKKEGNWKEISEFGEEVEEAISDSAKEESVKRFQGWRPKVEESEKDVKKKTIDEAVISENKLEKETEGVTKDLKQASGKVAEASKKAAKKQNPEKEIFEASEEAARPFYSKIARFFRKIESKVYSWFALRFNPYYLDTEDFAIDMKHKKNGEFQMDVAVPEEETRNQLKDRFKSE